MKIASVIYLSNQEIIGYPVDVVAKSLAPFVDEVLLLAGDHPSYAALEQVFEQLPRDVRHSVTRIEHPIATVGDIPSMMGAALDLARNLTDADFILISQADEVATPEVAAVLRSWAVPENRAKASHTYCRIGFLYQYSATGWGNTICGRDFAGQFRGDGLGFDEGGHAIGHIGDHKACYLEIGSLSPELYFRHQSQHVKTWREYGLMGPRLAAYPGAMERDALLTPWLQTPISRDEFLRLSLQDGRKRIYGHPLVPVEQVEPRYTPIIDAMGLRDDCTYVCDLVKKFGFDR